MIFGWCAYLANPLAPLPFRGAYRFWWCGLCDCRGLQGEDDLVCGLEQVLSDCRERQLGVGFGDAEIAGAVQSEEALHCTEGMVLPQR